MPQQDAKRIVNKIIESISEEPKMEPGQADETPGSEQKTEPKDTQLEDGLPRRDNQS
jgi:hypothetical protein